jgi:hypothetical protein
MAERGIKNNYKLQNVTDKAGGSNPTLSATITLASRRPIAILQNLLRFGRI